MGFGTCICLAYPQRGLCRSRQGCHGGSLAGKTATVAATSLAYHCCRILFCKIQARPFLPFVATLEVLMGVFIAVIFTMHKFCCELRCQFQSRESNLGCANLKCGLMRLLTTRSVNFRSKFSCSQLNQKSEQFFFEFCPSL